MQITENPLGQVSWNLLFPLQLLFQQKWQNWHVILVGQRCRPAAGFPAGKADQLLPCWVGEEGNTTAWRPLHHTWKVCKCCYLFSAGWETMAV